MHAIGYYFQVTHGQVTNGMRGWAKVTSYVLPLWHGLFRLYPCCSTQGGIILIPLAFLHEASFISLSVSVALAWTHSSFFKPFQEGVTQTPLIIVMRS